MKQSLPKIIRSESQLNYDYATIKITQSRIDKGLIAIPITMAEYFPDHNDTIQVYLDDSPISQTKHYSSYNSSTHECRIGGVRTWFQTNQLKNGDEIVIHFIDKEHFIYRLVPEKNFVLKTKELQNSFDNSENENEASEKITTIARWTHYTQDKVVLNEYYRLINTYPSIDRPLIKKSSIRMKESAPANLRTLLENIYKGHCQICDFWFLKKDNKPYFEIHHLDPLKSHHPQNLLVVCGNCHNQFEHACIRQEFNHDNWLVRVSFNEKLYSVKQFTLIKKITNFYKDLFV